MPDLDLTQLRKFAEAATQGPWTYVPKDPYDVFSRASINDWEGYNLMDLNAFTDDGQFIAAFNPATALALLDRIQELEATIQRVRDLPIYEVTDARGDIYDVVAQDELNQALEGDQR